MTKQTEKALTIPDALANVERGLGGVQEADILRGAWAGRSAKQLFGLIEPHYQEARKVIAAQPHQRYISVDLALNVLAVFRASVIAELSDGCQTDSR
jgi:hypothetical protein